MSNNRTKSKSVTDSLSGLDIYDPKFSTDPFSLYEKLHFNEPIIYLKNYGVTTIFSMQEVWMYLFQSFVKSWQQIKEFRS